jgi:DNA invertase Pin-like site-specific DNA recombinase
VDQSLDRQDLGDCERIFEEKLSGGSTDRPALQDMIAFVRSDDAVVIHSIDRLARNLLDLQSIIKGLNNKSATVHFILNN